jgi:hypothetical protein
VSVRPVLCEVRDDRNEEPAWWRWVIVDADDECSVLGLYVSRRVAEERLESMLYGAEA